MSLIAAIALVLVVILLALVATSLTNPDCASPTVVSKLFNLVPMLPVAPKSSLIPSILPLSSLIAKTAEPFASVAKLVKSPTFSLV